MAAQNVRSTYIVYVVAIATMILGLSPGDATASEVGPATPPIQIHDLTLDAIIAATPPGIPDTDGDGLPDPVEAVFGTMADAIDSDLDGLDDYFELDNALNPNAIDSNLDGLPDGVEVTGPLDIDGDNKLNAWDDDNDGDGVRDGVDLNPGARSAGAEEFHFNIASAGSPTYVDFQVRPFDESALKLSGTDWDWPWDQHGTIRNLDWDEDSADVSLHPMLQLLGPQGPDGAEVEGYGIGTMAPNEAAGEPAHYWKGMVPLSPVVDVGETVAFAGRMFYPEGVSGYTSVKLVWAVKGPVDDYSETQFVDAVDEARKAEIEALVGWPVPAGGTFFAGLSDSCTVGEIATTSPAPGTWEIQFTCDTPITTMGDPLSINLYQYLVNGVNIGVSEIDRFVIDEAPTTIARYQEPFLLTGLEATANHDIEVGVVFGDEPDQIVGAGLTLDYEYLRTQSTLEEAINQFEEMGLTEVTATTQTVEHFDQALGAAGEMIDGAFAGVAPVFTIIGERATTSIPTEWMDGEYIHDETALTLALDNPDDAVTTKTMALDWYDQDTGTTRDDFVAEIEGWQLTEEAENRVGLLALTWTAGETHVIEAGGSPVNYDLSEWSGEIGSQVEAGLILTSDAAYIGLALDASLGNWAFLKSLRAKGVSVSLKGVNVASMNQFKLALRNAWGVTALNKTPVGGLSKFGKFMRGLAKVGKVAEYAGLVIGAVQGFLIWYQSGWTLEGFMAGLGTFSLYALTFAVFYILGSLGTICAATAGVGCVVIGAAGAVLAAIGGIVLLLDHLFQWGWWDDFEAWWNGLWSEETWPLVDMTFEYTKTPELTIHDYDDNGLDVGDRISLIGETKRTHQATKSHTRASDMWFSGIFPLLKGDACALDSDGHAYDCLPTDACVGGPGAGTWDCAGDIADITGSRTDIGTYFDPPAIWNYVASGYDPGLDYKCNDMSTGTDCWVWAESRLELHTEPKVPSEDFWLIASTAYEGQFSVYHETPWWDPDPDYRTLEPIADDGSDNRDYIYLDILPNSLGEFLSEMRLTALDTDGDGVNDGDDDESSLPDADDDGLNDGFEIDLGTEPGDPDTDNDLINDGDEVHAGTDPKDPDSDDDTVNDKDEADGWSIEFVYFGTTFTTMVSSDPNHADADNDGLSDGEEKGLRTNPNSWDTDGDGFKDGPNTNPHATDDSYTLSAHAELVVVAPGLLANDGDDEFDPLRVESVDTFGMLGTLDWSADGAFTYDPSGAFDTLAPNETALAVFTYTLGDGRGGTDSANVVITIEPGIPPGSMFTDDDGSIFEADIEWLARNGITLGCNPPVNDQYCPHDNVTRGQMAAFLVRALGLTDRGTVDFVDDDHSIFEPSIEKLATAGITKGCNPPTNDKYCPENPVTRGQMAAFLVRALGLTDRGTVDFVDDDHSIFEPSIEKLATAGITKGCNPPTNDKYCPDQLVTREQMAAFLHRAIG